MTKQWIVGGDIDFKIDMEIDGTPINQRGFPISSSGINQALVTPASGNKLKIYRVTYTVSSNVTGAVQITLGSTLLCIDENPQAGGLYGFNITPNFDMGNINEILYISCPAGATIGVNVTYEEITP